MLLLRQGRKKITLPLDLSFLGDTCCSFELNNLAVRNPESALRKSADGEISKCKETIFPLSVSSFGPPLEVTGTSNSWVFCWTDRLLIVFPYSRYLVFHFLWSSGFRVIHPSPSRFQNFVFISFAIVFSPVFFYSWGFMTFHFSYFNSVEKEAEVNACILPSMFNWSVLFLFLNFLLKLHFLFWSFA